MFNQLKKRKILHGLLKRFYIYGNRKDKKYFIKNCKAEKELIKLIKEKMLRGNIYDIGSYYGFYSLLFAKKLREGRIYAFEPNPITFNNLRETIKVNKLEGKIKINHNSQHNKENKINIEKHEQWWEDNILKKLEEMKQDFGDGYEKHKEYPRKLIKEMNYKTLLDGGAGLCAEYYGFQKDYPDISYTGLDITPSFVKIGKEKGISIFQGSIENIPFSDSSFDCVYVRDTMRHLKGACEKALKECIRVAKKEAMVLFCIKLNKTNNNISRIDGHSITELYNVSYSKKKITEFLKKNKNVKFFYFERIDGKNSGDDLLRIFKQEISFLLKCKLYVCSRIRMHFYRNSKVFSRLIIRTIKRLGK